MSADAAVTAPAGSRRPLRTALARQWAVFALALFAGVAAIALLLLFLLEDAFIDRRLHDVGAGVRAGATSLPERFERIAHADAPPDLRDATAGQRDGVIREFRLADGRYVHVLAGRDDGGDWLLVHDVSDQLYVNAALRRGWPVLLGVALALVLIAWALARRSTRALERERETLAFLGHELRTPLQSARTSLALLQADTGNAAAWQRLQRAQDRLARASEAILWLGGEAVPAADARCDAVALLAALAGEFAPLAAARGQRIVLTLETGTTWPLPAQIAETVLANLLQNAIQHGDAGDIAVAADARGFRIGNVAAGDERRGFGLGLVLVQRLLARCGWRLDGSVVDGRFVVRGGKGS